MEFSILERLLLRGLLPQQGSILALKTIRKLDEDLLFSAEEIKEFNLQEPEGSQRIVWDPEKAAVKEIEISDVARQVIVKTLKHLDEQEQLTAQHLSLWERFVEAEEEKQ